MRIMIKARLTVVLFIRNLFSLNTVCESLSAKRYLLNQNFFRYEGYLGVRSFYELKYASIIG